MSASDNFFCTDLAWEHGVPLVGTATRGDIWFLLEFNERWGAKAFEESSLPEEVKDHLNPARFPNVKARTLMIRQDRTQRQKGVRFFVGQTHPKEPRLYEYHLQDYAELLDIDISSLAAGNPGDPAYLRDEPLYLVCTNGKRDQCCSVYGPETYQAMKEETGDAVWQSSHIGGHNQSPITLFFPQGINYARSTVAEIRRLIQAYRQRKIVLRHYRGRVGLENESQAAEHFWREQTGNLDLSGVNIKSKIESAENEWKIKVSDADGRNKHVIHLRQQFSDYNIPITCTKKKIGPISSYHRIR